MIANFINNRRLGLIDNKQSKVSAIISQFVKTKRFVLSRQFSHTPNRQPEDEFPDSSFNDVNIRTNILAVDSSGQYVLIGGSEIVQCFNIAGAKKLIKYDETTLRGFGSVQRLQFIPYGTNIYSATLSNEIIIMDTSSNEVISRFRLEGGRYYTSDWHHRDTNLIANCNSLSLELLDIRQDSAIRKMGNYFGCLWNPNNDNHLIVSDDYGSINTFDRRNFKSLYFEKYCPEFRFANLQMTPNGKYLFGWSRFSDLMFQWKYKDGQMALKYVYGHDIWFEGINLDTFVYNLQYYVTNSYLFMPMMSIEFDKSSIQVININKGRIENRIKAVKTGYNPATGTYGYARVDAVTGIADSHFEHQLYTLDDKCELGIWSFSSQPQEKTSIHSVQLERGRNRVYDF